ncbi:hypothetical protein NUH86_21085 [Sphingobium sp. JS3065]|uniref:hypothetical protein n=1 Tax=Sphingobium sp. JS3065 TaxID=2970925 RepID=UPI0022655E90|nr:hypothetical protein [Sphingobium sp. JS3065]UZW57221.1 hypothetical protein NUH86_21085 [Sphingobium sp. JS3065]
MITDFPITSRKGAIEKLQWYALRWKIEVFHKILKSGCRAEDAKLHIAERLVNLLAIYCVLSWRMFWMTMINCTAPTASPDIALPKDEIDLIDRIVIQRTGQPPPRQLSSYLTQIARLGGGGEAGPALGEAGLDSLVMGQGRNEAVFDPGHVGGTRPGSRTSGSCKAGGGVAVLMPPGHYRGPPASAMAGVRRSG